MSLRRVSIFLSVLAACLMALACGLGWRSTGSEAGPEAIRASGDTAQAVVEDVSARCRDLDDQFLTCSDSLSKVWRPAAPAHYPQKVRQLLSIKRRYEMETEAVRACRGEPDARVSGAALRGCLQRATCDGFANCVADNFDPFE